MKHHLFLHVIMKVQLIRFAAIIVSILMLFPACSSYQKLLKSDDYDKKYNAAVKYYKNEEYNQALGLFRDLLVYYRGSKRGQKVRFYYAYALYGTGQYQLASLRFKNFYETYSNSKHAEESLYMYAYCLYLNSPSVELDQNNTRKAINAFQFFTVKYPYSNRISKVNGFMDELRLKLEEKAIQRAKLYFKIRDYKAAVWALQNVLEKYPATRQKEELKFLVLKSQYLLAINSIKEKLTERLHTTLRFYRNFAQDFPNSQYIEEAKKIFNDVTNKLGALEKKENYG